MLDTPHALKAVFSQMVLLAGELVHYKSAIM